MIVLRNYNSSSQKQSQFVEQVNHDTVTYLRDVIKPSMEHNFADLLNKEFSLIVLEQDQTIAFAYPRMFDEASVLQEIRLEIGVLRCLLATQGTIMICISWQNQKL